MKDRKQSDEKKKAQKKQPEEQIPTTDSQTKELIQGALVEYLKDKLEERNNSRKNYDGMISVIEEFLNSFIVLGYTFDGQPIQYICAHNQQQADSLATLVNKFFQAAIAREDSSEDEPSE